MNFASIKANFTTIALGLFMILYTTIIAQWEAQADCAGAGQPYCASMQPSGCSSIECEVWEEYSEEVSGPCTSPNDNDVGSVKMVADVETMQCQLSYADGDTCYCESTACGVVQQFSDTECVNLCTDNDSLYEYSEQATDLSATCLED
jgi:hypothetical protein